MEVTTTLASSVAQLIRTPAIHRIPLDILEVLNYNLDQLPCLGHNILVKVEAYLVDLVTWDNPTRPFIKEPFEPSH
jgi:hypothetical protein